MPDRKLIRPALRDYKDRDRHRDVPDGRPSGRNAYGDSAPSSSSVIGPRRKQVPPEQTNAENFYYLKQMGAKTPVIVALNDGEELHGCIEWYDKDCIKVHCFNEMHMLVYKHSIKCICKERQS